MTRAQSCLIAAIAGVMLMFNPTVARAQDILDRNLGQPLAAIELRVEGRPETSPSLLNLIDIKPGDKLSVEAFRRVAQKFDQVPRFDGVSVRLDERPDGLVLIFDAIPKHPVNSVVVSGSDSTGMAPADIESRIREEFNGVPALARTVDVEETVKRILQSEGYLSAEAHASVVTLHDPDRSTMEIAVVAGPRTTITSVEIRGNSPLDPERTKVRLGVTPGAPFRERALTTSLEAIREELRAKQYYTAIAQHVPEFSADGSGVSLVITIEAGPLVVINVHGELPGRYDDYIPIKRENSIDRDLLDDAVAKIADDWHRDGYRHATATYTSETPSPDRQVITFTIDKGQRFRVTRVELPKDDPLIVPADFDMLKALKPGVWFDQNAVMAALGVIKGQFQVRGYHLVTLKPEFEEVVVANAAEGGVIIHPHIVEGPLGIVTKIDFDLDEHPKVTEADLREHMLAKQGQPFGLRNLVDDRRALPAYYESRGFLEQKVTIAWEANDDGTQVSLLVRAREGPQILVSEILVVGNEKVPVETIRREVTLKVGEPYSEAARLASQRALNRLEIFRLVKVSLDAWLPGETSARVVVAVEEASSKTYEFGGGVEAGSYPRTLTEAEGSGIEDRIVFAPRVSLGFARTNIGGRNRTLTMFGRLSLKPKTTDQNNIGSPDYRAIATYRERYAFGLKSDLLLSATAEQGLRTTYNFIKRATSLEFLRPLTPRVNVSSRYTLEWSKQFDDVIPPSEQLSVDRLYPQVRISMFSGAIAWDRRNDPLVTTHGGLVAVNSDLALKALGSEVGFLKTFVEGSWFHPLIGPRRLIFATRAQIGLARGFDPNTTPENALDDPLRDLPASQRYFSGGSATNRAYQLDRLGTDDIMTPDGLSKGGNGLVLFNAEVRALAGQLLKRDLTVVGFVDVGNVFHRVSTIDLAELKTGVGFGIRYDSWIGPLRLDFGFKTDRRVFTGGPERRWEFHLSIGEVF